MKENGKERERNGKNSVINACINRERERDTRETRYRERERNLVSERLFLENRNRKPVKIINRIPLQIPQGIPTYSFIKKVIIH